MNYKWFSIVLLALLVTINVQSAANSESNGFRSWFSKLPCVKACKKRQEKEAQGQEQNKERRQQAASDALLEQCIREEALGLGYSYLSDQEVEHILAKERMEIDEEHDGNGILYHYGSVNLFLVDSY